MVCSEYCAKLSVMASAEGMPFNPQPCIILSAHALCSFDSLFQSIKTFCPDVQLIFSTMPQRRKGTGVVLRQSIFYGKKDALYFKIIITTTLNRRQKLSF